MEQSTQKKPFLLIEHGGSRKQFVLDTLIKRTDIELYIATTSIPEWLPEFIPRERVIETDTYNSVRLLADIISYEESHVLRFAGVGTFFEHVVTQTADIAAALGLIGAPADAARRSSSNKLLMRRTCRDAGIRTPRFSVLSSVTAATLKEAIQRVGVPCVLKPIFGSESYGTVKIEEGCVVEDIISEVTGNTEEEKKEVFKNFAGVFILEEYIPGPVVSIDGIIQNGTINIIGSVEFIMGPEPRFTQEADYIPARFGSETMSAAYNMTRSIITATGLNNCGFHCELRIDPVHGPILLEIAARLPGGPLQPGHLEATGVNLTNNMLDVWLGNSVNMTPTHSRHVIQKAVFPRAEGTITTFEVPAAIANKHNMLDFVQIANQGEAVVTYPNIPKPFYYYAASASSLDELEQKAEEIESSIKIQIK